MRVMDAHMFGSDQATGGDDDHRHQQRVPIVMRARLRDRHSHKYNVRLLDLSVTGFRAEADYSLDAGQIVWLAIPGMEGLEADIAWRSGLVIGCSFRQPLYPAVLDHIVKTLGH
jgi:hypothetical protein